ncbi:hypothetical protein ACFY9A_38995 [Streptomyces rubradiris]|uniref:hypothetical protein n=1 Tax=Streptomyces rubradiris TaxID=285531 RepID=UPI0036E5A1DF
MAAETAWHYRHGPVLALHRQAEGVHTTVTGQNYTYRSALTGTDPIEVTYDPAHPGDAEQVIGLLGTLVFVLILAMLGAGAAVATFFVARAIAVLWGG